MNSRKELRVLSGLAKKILNKNKFLRIKEISDLGQRKDLFLYSIKHELNMKVAGFRDRIKEFYLQEKDVFFIRVKINLLKHKISYFIIEPKKSELKKIMNLIKIIERDLKNV